MWLLLGKIFAFVMLVATFIYLRSASAVLRSLLPKSLTAEMGLPLTATLFVAPSILMGAAFYWAHLQAGVIWISVTAVYISWAQDLVYVTGMIYYYFVLRRIRTRPASFDLLIRLEEYAAWPSTDVVRRPFDYLLPKLPFASRWKKTTVLIRPSDFRRFLHSNLRWIDEAELAPVRLPYAAFCAIPHFALPSEGPASDSLSTFKSWQKEFSKRERSAASLLNRIRNIWRRFGRPREQETKATRYYIVNRALHAELNDDLWATSRNLCGTPPMIIARAWKTFHFQESMRLRFVAMFSVADLLQRLLGAMVLCTLRDEGALINGKLGDHEIGTPKWSIPWSSLLKIALSSPGTRLAPLSRILFAPREDYEDWEHRLSPFAAVLGGPIRFAATERNVLGAWRTLGELRNKIIGHGGIGTHLKLRPLLYLSAVHHFFLTVMREIAELDLAVLTLNGEGPAESVVRDQGLSSPHSISGNRPAFACLPQEEDMVLLHPYIRYREGRLLIINRNTNEGTNYIDFNVANIFEPSYITLKTDRDEFIKPSSR